MEECKKSLLHHDKYKVLTTLLTKAFSTIAFSTTLFAGRSLALADMLTTTLQDLEDHSSAWSSFELKSWMSTNSEPSQEQSFQCGCLRVHIAHVIFVPKIYTVENFPEFNFRCRLDKYFNTKLFPICGISLIFRVQTPCLCASRTWTSVVAVPE